MFKSRRRSTATPIIRASSIGGRSPPDLKNANQIGLHGITQQSAYGVAIVSSLSASSVKGSPVPTRDTSDPIRPATTFSTHLDSTEALEVIRYTAIHTTRDSADPVAAALQTLDQQLPGDYDALFADHVAEWGRYWQNSDVLIDGDELAQKALRFTTYHVLISAPRHDEQSASARKRSPEPAIRVTFSGIRNCSSCRCSL